jgi:hypothetical protein
MFNHFDEFNTKIFMFQDLIRPSTFQIIICGEEI